MLLVSIPYSTAAIAAKAHKSALDFPESLSDTGSGTAKFYGKRYFESNNPSYANDILDYKGKGWIRVNAFQDLNSVTKSIVVSSSNVGISEFACFSVPESNSLPVEASIASTRSISVPIGMEHCWILGSLDLSETYLRQSWNPRRSILAAFGMSIQLAEFPGWIWFNAMNPPPLLKMEYNLAFTIRISSSLHGAPGVPGTYGSDLATPTRRTIKIQDLEVFYVFCI